MGTASGANTILGFSEETTYGTFVTPSRFKAFLSETLKYARTMITSTAIRGGLRQGPIGALRREVSSGAAGDIKMELTTTGWGLLFKHLLGAVATTNAGAAYTHTFTPGSLDGKSLSFHKQLRDGASSIVRAFQYPGSKITSMEISVSPDKMVEVGMSVDSRDEVANTTTVAATFNANDRPYSYVDVALSLAGSPAANPPEMTLKIENPMNVDRRFIGSAGKKSEPIPNAQLAVTGKLKAEFANGSNIYDRYRSDTPTPLVLTLTFPTVIPTTVIPPSVTFTLPDVRFDGDSPTVADLDLLSVDHEFKAVWDQTNDTVTIAYVTADATP